MVMPTEPGDGPHHAGLVRKACEIPLQIAPRYLGNVHEGIQEQLKPMLMTFSRDLGGVALSFKDVQPVSRMAKILYENHGVHLRVSTSMLLFAPRIGDVLAGRVNFIGHDHVGLTVYDSFKASISQAEFPPSYRKVSTTTDGDDAEGTGVSGTGMRWEDSENPENTLTIGREVIFAVRKLQTAADGLLVIAGTLQEEDSSSDSSRTVELGPTDAPIVVPKAARTIQHDTSEQPTSGAAKSRKRDREQTDGKKVKRQKTKQAQKQESSQLMEQKMLEENGGAPLTHKQKRTLKKMQKAEEAAAKRAAAAAALR